MPLYDLLLPVGRVGPHTHDTCMQMQICKNNKHTMHLVLPPIDVSRYTHLLQVSATDLHLLHGLCSHDQQFFYLHSWTPLHSHTVQSMNSCHFDRSWSYDLFLSNNGCMNRKHVNTHVNSILITASSDNWFQVFVLHLNSALFSEICVLHLHSGGPSSLSAGIPGTGLSGTWTSAELPGHCTRERKKQFQSL